LVTKLFFRPDLGVAVRILRHLGFDSSPIVTTHNRSRVFGELHVVAVHE
jgi:hypothetical protein